MIGTPDGPIWHDGSTWRQHASCNGSDLDWFPSEKDTPGIDTLRAVCSGCPVRSDCLNEELQIPSSRDIGGIRGGLTASERRALRKHREKEVA